MEHPEPCDFAEDTKECNAYQLVSVVDKPVNRTWNNAVQNDQGSLINQYIHINVALRPLIFLLTFIRHNYFPESPRKASVWFRIPFLGRIMAVVMGIVTIVRLIKSMPKKIAAVALYGESAIYYWGTVMKAAAIISIDDHIAMMKRMAELEEKVSVLNMRPGMPPEKEELLNNALSRVTILEQELASSKRVLDDAVAKQVELQAYIDERTKKKLVGFHW